MDFSRLKKYLVLYFVLISVSVNSYPLVPISEYTSGRLCTVNHADFDSYRYAERIPYCERNVSSMQKDRIYNLYRIPVNCRKRYTIDHFIPLSIGGDNSDANLWPEHKLVKATRPQLEQEIYVAISKGRITQKNAIEIIVREKTKTKRMLMNVTSNNCDIPS